MGITHERQHRDQQRESNMENTNVLYGFEDMTQWEKDHPGDIEFTCEFCGIYTASEPRCNKCEKE